MDWTDIVINILISASVSGIVGVIVNIWYQQKNQIKQAKLHVLQQLLGNRYDLRGEKFTEALNQIFVTFYNSKDVLIALKAFYEIATSPMKNNEVMNQRILDLFKAMYKDLKLNIEPLNDTFFLHAFNVKI